MATREPVVVWGIGQMGGVFARALLRAGRTVVPVRRRDDPEAVAAEIATPELVLVCVGEGDLAGVLAAMPASWRGAVGLLQNELLPRDWRAARIADPTVAVVWFEKKRGTDVEVIVPTPVAGPRADLLVSALRGIDVAARAIAREALLGALVDKNLYILTANIAGLVTGGTVGGLLADHRALVDEVAAEVIAIQSALASVQLPIEPHIAAMVSAFEADPDHAATGRSAPARLRRALAHADRHGLAVPRLRAIAEAPR